MKQPVLFLTFTFLTMGTPTSLFYVVLMKIADLIPILVTQTHLVYSYLTMNLGQETQRHSSHKRPLL